MGIIDSVHHSPSHKARSSVKLHHVVFGTVVVVLVAPIAWFFLTPIIQNAIVEASIKTDDTTSFVFEDTAQYTSSVAQKSIYYWSPEPITEIQTFFEEFFLLFSVADDEFGTWLITGYGINGGSTNSIQSGLLLAHEALCISQGTYRCVTVALVDYSQPDAYQLAVSSPSGFRRNSVPPELRSIPASGTLIIYSYYIRKFE